ncbi:HAD family hydrolase [Streptomyces sp. NPDC059506]|uniref:Beta-phosphoglucomutase n=1 Tax=Streptomyces thermolineatus TaxID=44033 RepID=A0ABN3MYF5_9ACTN|nr:beta-phosphoglucomutase family hydrolase [Streptomyces sp. HB2AG]MCZ2523498.1 beta-phosphoglucomutase family hydrolase [Streptomyces sp. HB2AG]
MSGGPGLPAAVRACLFDLDGVLTRTAVAHAAAWKQMFDEFLAGWGAGDRRPFDAHHDYDRWVDGRPRADGVRTFLASRGIVLPEGDPGDPPERPTVNGLGNRKNVLLLERIRKDGVETYPGSVAYVRAVRDAGLRRAVVSSSANCREILAAAGIEDLFEERVDGLVAARLGLPGKPRPDTFLEAARRLGAAPGEAAVFEDALAGVEAGRAGHFGLVVGVDRTGQEQALREHGADTVVKDLSELMEDRA